MFNPTGEYCSSIPPDVVFICQDLVSTAEAGAGKPQWLPAMVCFSHGKLVLIHTELFSSPQ